VRKSRMQKLAIACISAFAVLGGIGATNAQMHGGGGGFHGGGFQGHSHGSFCLGVMAAGCLVNARRCGRMHCYFTGPFPILMGLASLSYGFGELPLGSSGWNWLGGVTLGGAVLLGFVPELLFGKYRRR
jgi:hypothetical protein